MLKACVCRGCGMELYRIKKPSERRSIPVSREELWIKNDPKGDVYIKENGASVFGYPVGDSYDDDTDLTLAYEPHLINCPNNRRAPRKPRNRAIRDMQKGYDFEKQEYNPEKQ